MRASEPGGEHRNGADAMEARSAERRARHPTGTELRLRRSREGRILLGLCAGIAAYVGVEVTKVRWLFAITGALTLGTLAVAYLLLSLMIGATTSATARA